MGGYIHWEGGLQITQHRCGAPSNGYDVIYLDMNFLLFANYLMRELGWGSLVSTMFNLL